MRATLVTTLLIATVAVSSATPVLTDNFLDSEAYYYIQGAKGLWTGYQAGFYKNTKKDIGNCLNDRVIEDVMDIVTFFETFDTSKIMNIFGQGMEVFNSIQSCSIQQSFDDIVTFCDKHSESCNGQALMDNLTKNMFVLMGKITEATTILQDFPAKTAAELFLQTSSLGNIIGTILRVVSGFLPSA